MSELTQALRLCAQRYAERPALWASSRHYSYSDLFSSAESTAARLQRMQPENGVLVLAKKSFEGFSAILACFLSGATYIPLNDSFPDSKLASIVQRSGTTMLLVDPECADRLQSLLPHIDASLKIICSEHIELDTGNHSLISLGSLPGMGLFSQAGPAPEVSPAYLMFTSGSTGQPKGVPISEQNLLNYLNHIHRLYDFNEYDRHSQFFEFTFDLSIHDLLVCWTSGGCLYAADEFARLMPIHFARKHRLTVWFSVPSLISHAQAVLKQQFHQLSLPSLRYTLLCGEALPARLALDWLTLAPNTLMDNLYGPTEATIAFTRQRVNQVAHSQLQIVPIGKPFGANRVEVVDENNQPVADGETGQLALIGPQIATGYWRDDTTTAKSFIKLQAANLDPCTAYLTGDLVHKDEVGDLHFHGRMDHQIKIRGYRVELQEIETAISRITDIARITVTPYPLGEDGEVLGLIAFYLDTRLTELQVLNCCRQQLPDYMVPDRACCLTEFPLNANGKTDRHALLTIAREMDQTHDI
ncbi:amino acid adenylation domain-containing protein [Shewanella corallii]|uniref:Amino acid adenylation domain-containing protein n=1 Tax=Shewanella corallii TaxID=560080 RepID=A0ABT0N7Y7_9GAMM|nr:amino acid adenylation domain-containing protein [Shewanella corallii]MCL2914492.1 amino acid adenylation domain-containing protein [Shewanella corallii]